MPVTNGFGGGFVWIDGGELSKRDGHRSTLPSDQDEHVVRAIVVRHAHDLNDFAFLSGETTFAVRHLAWSGKRICFPDSNASSGPALAVRHRR
jgi:hypothetical protein